jgi:glycosyltransferase involved in cell wall biosynthesis
MVAVEAMAMGLPVILAKEVGIAAEVEKAKAGMVVNANPIEIGDAWRLLLSNQELREEMGKNGENLVREQFASEIVANKMLKLLSFAASALHVTNLK